MTTATRERFAITVEATADSNIPAVYRLRGLLKSMLRQHGLKAITINSVPPVAEVPPLVEAVASTITRQPSQPIDTGEAWGTAGDTGDTPPHRGSFLSTGGRAATQVPADFVAKDVFFRVHHHHTRLGNAGKRGD